MDDLALLNEPAPPSEPVAPPPAAGPKPAAAPEASSAPALPAAAPAEPSSSEAAANPAMPTIELPDWELETPAGAAPAPTPPVLVRLLEEHEPLRQLADSSPALRAQLQRLAERGQELEEYQALLPTPEQARAAAANAELLQNLDRLFYAGDAGELLDHLRESSLLRDPEHPETYRLDPVTHQPLSSGAYERLLRAVEESFLHDLEASGEQSVRDAAGALRQHLGWNPPRSASSAAVAADLPAPLRERLRQAEQMERELETLRGERDARERQASSRFQRDLADAVRRDLEGFASGLLRDTGLPTYVQEHVVGDFVAEMARAGSSDRAHSALIEEMLRDGGPTPATRERILARTQQWLRLNARPVLEPILRRAGVGVRRPASATPGTGRREPTTSATAAPLAQLTPAERVASLQQRLGRKLSDREILDL